MQYAVIKAGGKQYKVSVGDKIEVDRLKTDEQKSLEINDVLMVVEDDKVTIGKPTVDRAKVQAKILENKKGEKIHVIKYKSKVRYRKRAGFRPLLSLIEIEKINFDNSA